MTIKDVQYDFKKKLNKVDSEQNRNLLIPEIDWVINEAIELFVKNIAYPRAKSYLSFEFNQRTIDDIRTLVVRPESDPSSCIRPVTNNVVSLPTNYWHFIKGEIIMSKGTCLNKKGTFKVRQHDDEFENSPFDSSNFEWRTVNGVFFEKGIKLFDDGTFTNNTFLLHYIKKHPYVHNAEDFRNGTYKLPNGTTLTGTQNLILPEQTHREIVDIAVMIATGEIQAGDYATKREKLNFNQLGR